MRPILTLPSLIALSVFVLGTALGALAAPVTIQQQSAQQQEGNANSAIYNSGYGMTPGEENRPISGSNRDANGNLLIYNGIMTRSSVLSQQDGARFAGVGMPGSPNATATAIGNNLNVTVTGEGNTVIVDSDQRNSGDQTAGASLNGKLKF